MLWSWAFGQKISAEFKCPASPSCSLTLIATLFVLQLLVLDSKLVVTTIIMKLTCNWCHKEYSGRNTTNSFSFSSAISLLVNSAARSLEFPLQVNRPAVYVIRRKTVQQGEQLHHQHHILMFDRMDLKAQAMSHHHMQAPLNRSFCLSVNVRFYQVLPFTDNMSLLH